MRGQPQFVVAALALLVFILPGCAVAWVTGGKVSFEAYELSDRYADTPAGPTLSDPPKDMLSPVSDVVLILFYRTDAGDDPRFEILKSYRLDHEGRVLHYPPRPFAIFALSELRMWSWNTKEMGVVAFARNRQPIVLTEESGSSPYRGTFYVRENFEPRRDQLPGYECGPGTKGRAKIFFCAKEPSRAHRSTRFMWKPELAEGWAQVTVADNAPPELAELLRYAAQPLIRAVERSRELRNEDRLMVFRQMLDVIGRAGLAADLPTVGEQLRTSIEALEKQAPQDVGPGLRPPGC